jgi:hypothetical protein
MGSREKSGRLSELTREVALTPDQVEKISAALQTGLTPVAQFDTARVDAHLSAFATAFQDKSFDARTISLNSNGHLATYGAKRLALFYQTVAPLLTPEQRTTLAQHLREHAGAQVASLEQ